MIALATCAELPQGDPDDAALPALLGAEWAVWDDPAVDWSRYELVVVRSTWDYQRRRDDFLDWARRVPRVVNPVSVLEWNTDKRYLEDLPRAIPTTFVAPGGALAAPEGEYVVKPAISAGSRDTQRFGPGDDSAALIAAIHESGRTAMVQPYVPAVDQHGETALIYFGGRFSHAIRKGPILRRGLAPSPDVLFAEEDISARAASDTERALADEVIAWVAGRFGQLPYARVDVVPGPYVLELELAEPSLFFTHAAGAAERFAEVVRGL